MLSAREIKAMTGAPDKITGIIRLYEQVESKAVSWNRFCCGETRIYSASGYDSKRDRVHFTATWGVDGGGIGHSRVAISMKDALDNDTGDLSSVIVLL